jgi:hypothetical protein
MADTAIKINNSGNDTYALTAREWLTSPVVADLLRIILSTSDQLNNVIKIRHMESMDGHCNRDISIGNFVSAQNKSNLIIDVPLDPPVTLDGKTYFQTTMEPNSEIDLLFYFTQRDNSEVLQ